MTTDINVDTPEPDAERRYHEAIGAFMYEFSQFEFTFRMAIASMSGGKMFDVMTLIEHCDINKLFDGYLRLLENGKKDTDGQYAALVKEFREINVDRVRIAHGTWMPTKEGLAARKTPSNPKAPTVFHFSKIDDLKKLTRRCSMAHGELLELLLPTRED